MKPALPTHLEMVVLPDEVVEKISHNAGPVSRFASVAAKVEGIDFYGSRFRLRTRLPYLDRMLKGGYGPGLHLVSANQSQGKTEFVLNLLARNVGKNIIYLTSDDSLQDVLKRLWVIRNGGVMAPDTFDYDDVHAEYSDHNADLDAMREGIIEMAYEYGERLIVADGNFTLGDLTAVYRKAKQDLGSVDLVVFDYLDLLTDVQRGDGVAQGAAFGNTTIEKIRAFKRLSIEFPETPWLIMHQANKSSDGERGFNTWDMATGGHAEAKTITGLSRVYTAKGFEEENPTEAEFYAEHPTVNVVIAKNKQGGKTNAPFGHEFSLVNGVIVSRTWDDAYKRRWIRDRDEEIALEQAEELAQETKAEPANPLRMLPGMRFQGTRDD